MLEGGCTNGQLPTTEVEIKMFKTKLRRDPPKDEWKIKCARHLKLKGSNFKIDVLYEWDPVQKKYRMFTDDLRYSSHLEIVYSDKTACFTIKNLYKLRERWYKEQGKPVRDIDNTIKKYLEI